MKREKAKSDIGAMYERYYGRLMLIACSIPTIRHRRKTWYMRLF